MAEYQDYELILREVRALGPPEKIREWRIRVGSFEALIERHDEIEEMLRERRSRKWLGQKVTAFLKVSLVFGAFVQMLFAVWLFLQG